MMVKHKRFDFVKYNVRKLKKIQKLDVLRKDLDKLKYLSELPEMFKGALEEYNKEPERAI